MALEELLDSFSSPDIIRAKQDEMGGTGIGQCFSTFVRPRSGKGFFHKTRALAQQIYS